MSNSRRGFGQRRKAKKYRKLTGTQGLKRRPLGTELLESRVLMAADLNPWHNNMHPTDVNGDDFTTALDAMHIINQLNATGATTLATGQTNGEGEPGEGMMVDVNGDGQLTPNDALNVINFLNGQGDNPVVARFVIEMVNSAGTPITTANVGDTFNLRVSVQDVRDPNEPEDLNNDGVNDLAGNAAKQGLDSAYTDVDFDKAIVSATAGISSTSNDFLREDAGAGATVLKIANGSRVKYVPGQTVLVKEDGVVTARAVVASVADNGTVTDDLVITSGLPSAFTTNATIVSVPYTALRRPSSTDNTAAAINQLGVINEAGGTRFDIPPGDGPLGNGKFLLYTIPFKVDNPPTFTTASDTQQVNENSSNNVLSVLSNDVLRHPMFVGNRPEDVANSEINLTTPVVNLLKNNVSKVDFGSATLTINGYTLSLVSVQGMTKGTASIFNNNTPNNPSDDVIRYTPNTGESGQDVFTYTVTNGQGTNRTETITVSIGAFNDPPVVTIPAAQTANEDVSLTINGVSVADPDVATGSMQMTLAATNGAISLASTTGLNITGGANNSANVTFTGSLANVNAALNGMQFKGTANYNGPATVTITANDQGNTGDGGAKQDSKTVSITVNPVNDAPVNTVPSSKSALLSVDSPITGISVSDPDGNVNVRVTVSASNGIVKLTQSGGATVTNNNSASAQISGTVTAVNSTLASLNVNSSTVGTHKLTVLTNDLGNTGGAALEDSDEVQFTVVPPVKPFAVPDTFKVTEGSSNNALTPFANDIVTDTGTTSVSASDTAGTAGGTISRTGDNFSYTPPNAEFFGSDSFTYTISSTEAGTTPSTATVTVTVSEVNDPVTATNDPTTAMEDTPKTIAGETLTSNDSPGPANEENSQNLTVTAVSATSVQGGTVTVSGNQVVYTPKLNFVGQDTFTYTVTDNGTTDGVNDFKSATATVTVTVSEDNDNPVPMNDTATVAEDSSVTITNVLNNDAPGGGTDETGQTLSVTAVSATSQNGGSVTRNGNSIVYTPAGNFFGQDTFTYTVSDNGTTNGNAAPKTATGTVTVTVTPVNDNPVPGNDQTVANTVRERAVTFSTSTVLGNDVPGPQNESSQTLAVSAVTSPTAKGGTITLNGANFIYTPANGFSGTDTFTYTVTDNGQTNGANEFKSASATASIFVQPFLTSTISGRVYSDDNGDGHDMGEHGIAGITITLTGTDFQNQAVNKTTVTNAEGRYTFDNLLPGTYDVVKGDTLNFADGDDTLGTATFGASVNPSEAVRQLVENDHFRFKTPSLGGMTAVDNLFGAAGLQSEFRTLYEAVSSTNTANNPTAGQGMVITGDANGQLTVMFLDGWQGYSNARFSFNLTTGTGRFTIRDPSNNLVGTTIAIGRDPHLLLRVLASGEYTARIRGDHTVFNLTPQTVQAEPDAVDALMAEIGA